MKRLFRPAPVFLFALWLMLVTTESCLAFRCGTRLVSEGDTRAEVILKCGEPDFIDSREEERISRDFRVETEQDVFGRTRQSYREPVWVKETVKIEMWTYNLGSNRFIRYLRFENGILTGIATGEKGY